MLYIFTVSIFYRNTIDTMMTKLLNDKISRPPKAEGEDAEGEGGEGEEDSGEDEDIKCEDEKLEVINNCK